MDMSTLDNVALDVILAVCAAQGLACIFSPHRVMAFAKRLGAHNGHFNLTARIYYSTARMTRASGTLLIVFVAATVLARSRILPTVWVVLFGAFACGALLMFAIAVVKAYRLSRIPSHSDPDVQAILRGEISLIEYAERKRQTRQSNEA